MSTQHPKQIPRVISEDMSLVESEDDERPSWAFVRIQKVVFIYEATECFGCLQFPAFQNVPAMVRFIFVANLFVVSHCKLERTVILTKTGKDRKFTLSANLITLS